MIAAIQTHGELLHWHPHIHTLLTCGAFTAEGEFLEVPELDMDRLREAWREAVFALYLAEEKIEPEVVENMLGWPHLGFSVDQSVFLPARDRGGIERLVGYMTRCPFSLSRLVKVTETGQCGKGNRSNLPERPGGCCAEIGPVPFSTGQVVYQAEKDTCRAFPEADGDGLRPGPKRNFQVIAFIEPPQRAVIEKILRHCGLWQPSTPRAPPPEDGWVYEPDADWDSQPISSEQSGELTFVEM